MRGEPFQFLSHDRDCSKRSAEFVGSTRGKRDERGKAILSRQLFLHSQQVLFVIPKKTTKS